MTHRCALVSICVLGLVACGDDPAGPAGPDAATGDAAGADATAPDADPACPADPVPPGTGSCPAECTGGCDGTTCTIDCGGNGSPCDGADIVCPPDFDCVVLCTGLDACDTGTITCPAEYGCRVECSGGTDACGDQQITCGAGPCTIDCAPDTCNGATVDCGTGPCGATCDGAAPADLPTLDCTGACGCTTC